MTSFSQRVWIALIYTSNELNSGALVIKMKISTQYLIFSRVFIYPSNKPLCGTLIINLGKKSVCACYCKQIKHPLQESNKNTKNVLAI